MNVFKKIVVIFVVALCAITVPLLAQTSVDSLHQLPEIIVTAKSYNEVIPAQKLTGKELKSMNSLSVADAIRYFSGIQIKDYGGIGGLKTVDIRSMGTNHMGVFYDGIQLGNAQNGQIDLGKFSLDNIESISLYNGQKSEIFQPARDFGTSGSVYLRSRRPTFEYGDTYNIRAVLRSGSFHLFNPSVLWEQKISDNLSTMLNAEWVNSSGKYKYRYKRVHPLTRETVYDTTAVRENGDIDAIRLEGGLYGLLNQGHWNVKSYFYTSERGIPGAIVNNIWKRAQRQWDRNFFVQGAFFTTVTPKYDMQVNAKYANDYMRYLNPDTTLMYIDNSFQQQEFYVSLANKYSILSNWDVSLSGDFQWNTLDSDLDGFVSPTRYTTLVAAATAVDFGKLKMQGSILGTFVNDKLHKTDSAAAANHKNRFTPALFASYKPFARHNLSFRAFYKHIFRMPTFNDLYYTDIGNAQLEPEYTHQYNVGLQYEKNYSHGFIRHWQIQTDAYYNQVTNKIIAVPKGSGMYRWMMMNVGEVEIRGIDFSANSTAQFNPDWLLNVKASYTFQKAQDFTRRKNKELEAITYSGQIAYIPWHSGSLVANLMYKEWQLNYSFIYIGERYHSSANIHDNYEQPWYTSDLSLVKTFTWKNFSNKLSLEVNNLFSQDYEVVLNYPMPKRNYKLTLTVEI